MRNGAQSTLVVAEAQARVGEPAMATRWVGVELALDDAVEDRGRTREFATVEQQAGDIGADEVLNSRRARLLGKGQRLLVLLERSRIIHVGIHGTDGIHTLQQF